jgi:hypothetical protein
MKNSVERFGVRWLVEITLWISFCSCASVKQMLV